ncbi:MAG: hypothetical protein HY608_02525 [Planctomycetes bacterium]|nr:hypothetical protein [Planctomycetota bacterium]
MEDPRNRTEGVGGVRERLSGWIRSSPQIAAGAVLAAAAVLLSLMFQDGARRPLETVLLWGLGFAGVSVVAGSFRRSSQAHSERVALEKTVFNALRRLGEMEATARGALDAGASGEVHLRHLVGQIESSKRDWERIVRDAFAEDLDRLIGGKVSRVEARLDQVSREMRKALQDSAAEVDALASRAQSAMTSQLDAGRGQIEGLIADVRVQVGRERDELRERLQKLEAKRQEGAEQAAAAVQEVERQFADVRSAWEALQRDRSALSKGDLDSLAQDEGIRNEGRVKAVAAAFAEHLRRGNLDEVRDLFPQEKRAKIDLTTLLSKLAGGAAEVKVSDAAVGEVRLGETDASAQVGLTLQAGPAIQSVTLTLGLAPERGRWVIAKMSRAGAPREGA